jgi:membrane AbrB-like protein
MLAAAAALNVFGVVLAYPVAWIAGVDRWTAILACLPGGMAEMSNLARELGGQEAVVATIHALRVILLIALLPIWLGEDLPERVAVSAVLNGAEIVVLAGFIAVSIAFALLSNRLGLMNPWVVIPMLLGFVVVALGRYVPPMPEIWVIAAQIAIGASVGARFDVAALRALPRAALAGVFSTFMLAAFAFVALAPLISVSVDLADVEAMLASAPGGLGEMIAAATALGLASASVAGFQFVRSLTTNALAPPIIREARRWFS